MAEPSIVAVLLKHTYQMVPYITATNRFSKGFLKVCGNKYRLSSDSLCGFNIVDVVI